MFPLLNIQWISNAFLGAVVQHKRTNTFFLRINVFEVNNLMTMQYKNINNKIIVHLMWYLKPVVNSKMINCTVHARQGKFIIEAVSCAAWYMENIKIPSESCLIETYTVDTCYVHQNFNMWWNIVKSILFRMIVCRSNLIRINR